MADHKSTNHADAGMETVGGRMPPTEALRQRALRVLEELKDQEGRAFAIATAGRALVRGDENAINEQRLFESIEETLSDPTLVNMLAEIINELARSRIVGSTECLQPPVNHQVSPRQANHG